MGFVRSVRFLEIICDLNKAQVRLLSVPEIILKLLRFPKYRYISRISKFGGGIEQSRLLLSGHVRHSRGSIA